MNKIEIDQIVREVLRKSGLEIDDGKPERVYSQIKTTSGPAAMIVFHAGVRYLKKSFVQVRRIEKIACRSSFLTATSACSWISEVEVRAETGIKCCLDKVKPEGVEKALKKADILVLPTFCLKTAAKVANLIGDTAESAIILSALIQGKKVIATCDSFAILEILANDGIQAEIDRIQAKLESFGMLFCNTDELSTTFDKTCDGQHNKSPKEPKKKSNSHVRAQLKLITAKDIQVAVNNHQTSILLAAGGIVTPLAKDQAKDYAIKIIASERFSNR